MAHSSKPIAAAVLAALFLIGSGLLAFRYGNHIQSKKHDKDCCTKKETGCVFRTLAGFDKFDESKVNFDNKLLNNSITKGLGWIVNAQHKDGGWGAGSHYHQDVMDPQAVQSDPATTSVVSMAILRCDQQAFKGKYGNQLSKALDYLLKAVENSDPKSTTITKLNNTQPQIKLGQNIDVILTSQFFTDVMRYVENEQTKARIEKNQGICIQKIQMGQDSDGGWKQGGWAPVLQSALANNALEAAKYEGYKVDSMVLERSRNYQKNNFDVKTNSSVTGKAAGVMLYAVSGSARAAAKEAQLADVVVVNAKKEGKLRKDDKVTEENLIKAGLSKTEATKAVTAYKIRGAASMKAQEDDIMSGFGSNGGEEYLSYLMTGESLIISKDSSWNKWFDKMSGRLVQIQGNDGSWNGHHCITSPVFCTATCLLILSINNDIDYMVKIK